MKEVLQKYVIIVVFSLASNLLSTQLFAEVYELGPINKKINLGVVVNSPSHVIYRSSYMNERKLGILAGQLEDMDMPMPELVIYMNKNGYSFPFYFAMEEWKLKDEYGFELLHPFHPTFRTYVDGHNPYFPKEDIDTKLVLGREARKYFKIRNDGVDGGIDTFLAILEAIMQARGPVLFHCHGGMHRTGMIAMALRYIQAGYWTEGTTFKKRGITMNAAQYEYSLYNPILFRHENLKFIEQLSQDSRFQRLKALYRQDLLDGSEQMPGTHGLPIITVADSE